MTAGFRTSRKKLGPSWLTSGEGELVGYALDLVRDAFMQRLFLGLLSRFPQQDPNGTAGALDALVSMGRDRRVIRGINESDAAYALRQKSWLDDRKRAGNPFMLMKQLAAVCGPLPSFRTVDASGNWYSRAADGTETSSLATANWNWDGDPARWARFWVVIYPNGLWVTTVDDWGDVGLKWGATDHTWGSTITPNEVAILRAVVSDWMPGGTRCINIILSPDGAAFDPTAPDPDGLWGRWSKNVGGVRVASRLATARYLEGVRA